MKIFISTLLVIGLCSQLCMAYIDSTSDKRFSIFEAFLTKAYAVETLKVSVSAELFTEAWPKFNEAVENDTELGLYKTEKFEEFSKALNKFLEAAKQVDGDRNNCDYLKVARDALTELTELECAQTFQRFSNIYNRTEEIYIETTKSLFTDVVRVFTTAIENFQQTLDVNEREQYKDFLVLCENFVKADNIVDQYITFHQVFYTFDVFELSKSHCKWLSDTYPFFMLAVDESAKKSMTPEELELFLKKVSKVIEENQFKNIK